MGNLMDIIFGAAPAVAGIGAGIVGGPVAGLAAGAGVKAAETGIQAAQPQQPPPAAAPPPPTPPAPPPAMIQPQLAAPMPPMPAMSDQRNKTAVRSAERSIKDFLTQVYGR